MLDFSFSSKQKITAFYLGNFKVEMVLKILFLIAWSEVWHAQPFFGPLPRCNLRFHF